MNTKRKLELLTYISIPLILFSEQAYAYIDPGVGSYIFQAMIAGVLSSLFFFRNIKDSTVNFFKKIKKIKKA